MSRPLRIEFPGALYHLTARGNERKPIVADDFDRERWMATLARVVERFHWSCHAYCLMDNHHHLLVETPRANLSRGMRELNGVYAQAFNRRHRRSGHLFGGRFAAILVERDPHLLEVCRYLVLNPLRIANPVSSLDEFPWSSYRATAGLAAAPAFLTSDWLLAQFGTRRGRAQIAFRRFVANGLGADPFRELKAGIYPARLPRARLPLTRDRRRARRPLRGVGQRLEAEEAEASVSSQSGCRFVLHCKT